MDINKLKKFANKKIIITTISITLIFYIFTALYSQNLIKNMNPKQTKATLVLNSQFNYSQQEAYEFLNSYSKAEISVLGGFTYPCDFIIAILYGMSLALSLMGLYKKIIKKFLLPLCFIPIAASIFNMIENIFILLMLSNISKKTIFMLSPYSQFFTRAKILFLLSTIIILISGLIILLVKRINKTI